MSKQDLRNVFEDYGCLPHQAEFAAKFLAPDSPGKHLLSSLPGLGKGFVGSAIVGYAVTHGLARRVLVLAPTALTYQWCEMMGRASPNVPCMVVDRRRLRELETADGEATWATTSVIITSIDFAKQEDVADYLMRSTWDMLVVDEAHHLKPSTQRHALVVNLLEHSPDARTLFLQALAAVTESSASSNPLFNDIATTVWSRETVRDKDGKPLLPEVHVKWICHRRRDDEVRVLSELQVVLQAHVSQSRSQLEATMLLQTASSSLFALEQRLNRMRRLRNEIAHGLADRCNCFCSL
jgi:SNF2 family DNA or RNA helicase